MKKTFITSFMLSVLISAVTGTVDKNVSGSKALDNFIKLFKYHRAQQLEAIKGFHKLKTYEKQYSMAEILGKSIFEMLVTARAKLESSGYIPGVSNFPTDPNVQGALISVLENTALFGEIILRLPDITMRLLKNHHDWEIMYQWCLTFVHENEYLIDKATLKLLDLVSQEMNYTTRHPDYHNPYRIVTQNSYKSTSSNSSSSRSKKSRKKISKGPMLSRIEL